MKKLLTILLILASAMMFYSCADRAPQRTAQQFLQLFYIEHDFTAVMDVVTESSLDNLMHSAMMLEFNPMVRAEAFQTFEITGINIQNTVATVTYRVDSFNRRLMLRNIDGRWLVDISNEVTQQGSEFSISLTPPSGGGGFASAESELTRIGDVPQRGR